MRRIGTVIVLAAVVVIAKFGGLISLHWEQLRVIGELALIWLVYDMIRSPVTLSIVTPQPHPHLSKMMAVKAARVSNKLLKIHLKSGEMRRGFVLAHSLSQGSFILTDIRNDYSSQCHYDITEVDELIVISDRPCAIIGDEGLGEIS